MQRVVIHVGRNLVRIQLRMIRTLGCTLVSKCLVAAVIRVIPHGFTSIFG